MFRIMHINFYSSNNNKLLNNQISITFNSFFINNLDIMIRSMYHYTMKGIFNLIFLDIIRKGQRAGMELIS